MKYTLNTLAISFALISLPCSASVVSTYAVDLHGTSQPDTLAPGHVAGVVPTTNWDAAIGLTGGGSTLTNTGIGGSMVYGWNSVMDGVIGGSTSAIGDEDMMEGYLVTRPLSPTITFQMSLPSLAALGWDSYDIYVYSNAGTVSLPTSNISLFPGGGGSPITYAHSDLVPGYGAGTSSYVDSQTSSSGNYVVYSGRTETTQFIEIEAPVSSLPGEAYLNGIEIVGIQVPEPSTGLLALIGALPLLLRRRSKG